MVQADYFEASGGVLGGDRRFRLQGVNLNSDEAIRAVRVTGGFSTSLFGNSSPLPTNFSALAVSVAMGQDLVTPPVGDYRSNPNGEDWLGFWQARVQVLGRSIAPTVNAWELRISLDQAHEVQCPRVPFGAARSIWVVSSVLPPVQAGTVEWAGGFDFWYYSVRP